MTWAKLKRNAAENILHAQTQLLKRAKANGLAAIGKYEGEESSIWC